MKKATFGMGCLRGVESFFHKVPGVMDAVSRYAGGELAKPAFRQVCTDTTVHVLPSCHLTLLD